jgi:hypothetical protein
MNADLKSKTEIKCGPQGEPKVKVCEACGASFDCFTPRGPCWCEDVKLSSETLAELKAKYRECLCPACLKDAAAKEESSPG